ncbi:MAG: hypothetical protein ACTSR2_05390 [Candidatus Hodarchaeales archaeon]
MVPIEVLFLYLLAIYIITIVGGGVFVWIILKVLRVLQKKSDTDTDYLFEGLRGAGIFVGVLERMIILTLGLLNQYGAISFVFLAKSMARFKQLEKRDFAEYYLIGTLSSFFIALIIAILAQVGYQFYLVPSYP